MCESISSNWRVTFLGQWILKSNFTKAATTIDEQIDRLLSRGMIIDDYASACFYLQHLNYYRLGAYWLPFEEDHGTHTLRQGTRFSDVLNLYIFDRELRLIVLDAIERIEVSVRSHWAFHLSHRHGPHAHLNSGLFDTRYWRKNLDKLSTEVHRSDEVFIHHHLETYLEELPPAWAVCEVMTLGMLSRWYDSLKPYQTRRAIAATYGVDEQVLKSWLHHLSLVRNVCAHHSRLWNREFTITPNLPRTKPSHLAAEFMGGSRSIYNTLIILLHGMDIVAGSHHWRSRLKALIAKHDVPTVAMGFPDAWNERAIWQDVEK